MRLQSTIATILILFTMVCVLASISLAGPAIELPDSEFNFGRISQHAKVAHRFWVKSTGDDTLRILKVEPGCGCTKAPLKDSILAPGDSTSLDIIFSTKSYRGFVSKRPYLVTNIGEERYYVRISSELLPEPENAMPVSLSPARLDVSQFRAKPRLKAKFLVLNKGDVDLDILLVDYAEDYFTVELPAQVKAGETIEGIIAIHEHLEKEEFDCSLTIQISDEERTRYSLPIKRMYRVKPEGK